MSEINWGLLQPVDAGAAFLKGWEQGKARRAEAMTGEALNALLQDPNGANAQINALAKVAPDKAVALLQLQQKQQDRQRDAQYRDAQASYVSTFGPINALMPRDSATLSAVPQGVAGSDGAPPISAAPPPPSDWQARLGPEAMKALTSAASGGANGMPETGPVTPSFGGQPLQSIDPSSDLGATPAPTAAPAPAAMPAAIATAARSPNMETRNRAFQAMLKIDPMAAMKIDSEMRDAALDRLEDANKAYRFAVARLPLVKDEAGYQQTLQQVDALLAPLGVNIRETVPANYPGPEGTRQLLMQAMEAQEQLAAIDRRFEAEARVEDMEADNERQDRNTDNLIANRDARTAQAGERERRIAAGTGRGKKGKRGKGSKVGAATIVNPTTGERMVLSGGKWVPAR